MRQSRSEVPFSSEMVTREFAGSTPWARAASLATARAWATENAKASFWIFSMVLMDEPQALRRVFESPIFTGGLCRLSLRERTAFRGAKGDDGGKGDPTRSISGNDTRRASGRLCSGYRQCIASDSHTAAGCGQGGQK